MVAVAVPFAPPQHSPMFGHFASSQTYIKSFIVYILQKYMYKKKPTNLHKLQS